LLDDRWQREVEHAGVAEETTNLALVAFKAVDDCKASAERANAIPLGLHPHDAADHVDPHQAAIAASMRLLQLGAARFDVSTEACGVRRISGIGGDAAEGVFGHR